ncbi:MAG: hypothetical protein HYW48_10030 [Deltaproteobacteria bacterium]|nr:hypothetical protein [Deltaproteobacteria bacterium]
MKLDCFVGLRCPGARRWFGKTAQLVPPRIPGEATLPSSPQKTHLPFAPSGLAVN